MTDLPEWITVSFSGGKDSTAMLLHMIENGDHIDEVINIDTGMEFPQMYEHIRKVKSIVEEHGIKYTTIRDTHTFEWYMFDKPVSSKKYGEYKGYGFPTPVMRWCTKHMKMEPLRKYLAQYRGKNRVIHCVGLASDEMKRLSRPNNIRPDQRHPLVDWGWSEKDCLEYCYNRGFDWGGLYNHFTRVSCWCCPLASLGEFRQLYRNYPELWKQLQSYEDKLKDHAYGLTFTKLWSVRDLGKRFEREIRAEKSQTHLEDYNLVEMMI